MAMRTSAESHGRCYELILPDIATDVAATNSFRLQPFGGCRQYFFAPSHQAHSGTVEPQLPSNLKPDTAPAPRDESNAASNGCAVEGGFGDVLQEDRCHVRESHQRGAAATGWLFGLKIM
jgi:hypothetical protein